MVHYFTWLRLCFLTCAKGTELKPATQCHQEEVQQARHTATSSPSPQLFYFYLFFGIHYIVQVGLEVTISPPAYQSEC